MIDVIHRSCTVVVLVGAIALAVASSATASGTQVFNGKTSQRQRLHIRVVEAQVQSSSYIYWVARCNNGTTRTDGTSISGPMSAGNKFYVQGQYDETLGNGQTGQVDATIRFAITGGRLVGSLSITSTIYNGSEVTAQCDTGSVSFSALIASPPCYGTWAQQSPVSYYLEVTSNQLRYISCEHGLSAGHALWLKYKAYPGGIPTSSYPPPPRGVPGGKGRPFHLDTPVGGFTCTMNIRGSDFVDATCHRGRIHFHALAHMNCCLATAVDRSAVERDRSNG